MANRKIGGSWGKMSRYLTCVIEHWVSLPRVVATAGNENYRAAQFPRQVGASGIVCKENCMHMA